MQINPRRSTGTRSVFRRLSVLLGAWFAVLTAGLLSALPASADDYTGPFEPPGGGGGLGGLGDGKGPTGGNGNGGLGGLLPNTGSEIALWMIVLAVLLAVTGYVLLRRARRA